MTILDHEKHVGRESMECNGQIVMKKSDPTNSIERTECKSKAVLEVTADGSDDKQTSNNNSQDRNTNNLEPSESTPFQSDNSLTHSQSSARQTMASPRCSQSMEIRLQLEEQKDLRNILQTCLNESLRLESIYRAVLLFDEEQARPPTFHKKGLLNKVKTLKAEIAQQEMELEYYEKTLGETQDELDYWVERHKENQDQQIESVQSHLLEEVVNSGQKEVEKEMDDEVELKLQHVRDAITRIRSRLSTVAEFNDLCGRHVTNMGMSGAVQLATNLAIEYENLQKRVQQTQNLNDQLSKKLLAMAATSEEEIVMHRAMGHNVNGEDEEDSNKFITPEKNPKCKSGAHKHPNQENVAMSPQHTVSSTLKETGSVTSKSDEVFSSLTTEKFVEQPSDPGGDSVVTSSPQHCLEPQLKINGQEALCEASSDLNVPHRNNHSMKDDSPEKTNDKAGDCNGNDDNTDNNQFEEEDLTSLFIELAGGPDRVISLKDLLERWIDLQEMLDVEDLYHEELVAIYDGIPKVTTGRRNGDDSDSIEDNEKIDLKGFLSLYQGIEDLFIEDYDSEDGEYDSNGNATSLTKRSISITSSFSLWELLRRMVGISKKSVRAMEGGNPYYKLPYRTKSSHDVMTV